LIASLVIGPEYWRDAVQPGRLAVSVPVNVPLGGVPSNRPLMLPVKPLGPVL
jgi:hypothetical protein